MIIKTTRLQAWTPAVGARVGRRPSPPLENKKKVFFAILGAFLLRFSSYGGLFATFYLMVGAFLGLAPPPTKISAGAHDCKEGSKGCMLPGNFFVGPRFSEFWTCFVTILP